MGIKDTNFEFDNIPANGFQPGTSVSGRIKFTTDKPIRMKNISLVLQGRAKVKFLTHEIHWLKVGNQRWRDNTILGFGRVFDVNWSDINLKRRLSDRECFTSEQIFVGVEQLIAGESCLHIGRTEYPFSFQLPLNIPPTFDSKNGEIRYKIKVKWIQSGFLKPSDMFKVELPVVNSELMKYSHTKEPQLWEPRLYQEIKPFSNLFSSTDPFKIELALPKSIVISGEILNVNIRIDNSTNTRIKSISLRFIQRTAWLGKHWSHKNVKIEDVMLQVFHFSGVPAQTNKSWTQPIHINAEPLTSIEPCSIIKLFHLIMVEVVPSEMYGNINLVAPIEVCLHRNEKCLQEQVSTSSSNAPTVLDSSEPPPPYSEVVSTTYK